MGFSYNKVLADVQSTSAGTKCMYCTLIYIVTCAQWRLAQRDVYSDAQKSRQTGPVIQLVICSAYDKPESAIYVQSLIPI